jgi:hypothetical protein
MIFLVQINRSPLRAAARADTLLVNWVGNLVSEEYKNTQSSISEKKDFINTRAYHRPK